MAIYASIDARGNNNNNDNKDNNTDNNKHNNKDNTKVGIGSFDSLGTRKIRKFFKCLLISWV